MQSVNYAECRKLAYYAECRHVEYRGAVLPSFADKLIGPVLGY
jgi:hypothetical protein